MKTRPVMGVLVLVGLSAACSVGAGIGARGPAAAEKPTLENGSFVADLNGVRIHYEVHGKGPALMTVPNSWGITLDGLRALYRPLEDRLTMVYFDPPGMGQSGPIREDADMGLAAVREDFEALRRRLGLRRVRAIGWSNGAMNLILLAAERPDSLSSAIFVHGSAKFTEEDEKALAQRFPEQWRRFEEFGASLRAPELTDADRDGRLKEFVVSEYFPMLFANPEAGRAKLAEMYRAVGFSWRHFAHANRETPAFDFTDRLPATSEGRMLGVLLALAGMGMFAVLTACFASWFIEQEEEEEEELLRQLTGEVAALRDEIRLLREGSRM
jgi:pimeloyl-ACP methyl ester carboxylesterase